MLTVLLPIFGCLALCYSANASVPADHDEDGFHHVSPATCEIPTDSLILVISNSHDRIYVHGWTGYIANIRLAMFLSGIKDSKCYLRMQIEDFEEFFAKYQDTLGALSAETVELYNCEVSSETEGRLRASLGDRLVVTQNP